MMKYDISALGNALVDTQYKVSHEFLKSVGLEADSMTLASAEEQAPIIEELINMSAESVSDCGALLQTHWLQPQTMVQNAIMFAVFQTMKMAGNISKV